MSTTTVLNTMLTKIESQLNCKNINTQTSYISQQFHSNFLERKNKFYEEKPTLPTTTAPNVSQSLQSTTQSNNYIPFYTTNNETHKLIERELDPYILSAKAEVRHSLELFRRESKDFVINQSELETYKQVISSNKVGLTQLEDYSKGEFNQLSEKTLELNCGMTDLRERYSEVNRKVVQLSDELNSVKSAVKMKSIEEEYYASQQKRDNEKFNEERMMAYVNERINDVQRRYEMRIEQILLEQKPMRNDSGDHSKQDDYNSKIAQGMNEIMRSINEIKENNERNRSEINALSVIIKRNEGEIGRQNGVLNEMEKQIKESYKANDDDDMVKQSKMMIVKSSNNRNNNNNNDNDEDHGNQREYVDHQITMLQGTINKEIKEMRSNIDEMTAAVEASNMLYQQQQQQIQQNKQEPPIEVNNKITSLAEQNTLLLNQISQIKIEQTRLTSKINNINLLNSALRPNDDPTNTNNNNIDYNAQYDQVRSELASFLVIFQQYKQEQIKLNDIYEQTLKSLTNHIVTLQSDNNDFEDNLIKIQDNFEKINPILGEYPKTKQDFALLTEIIKTLSQNYQELQGEMNANFNALSDWQTELVKNITKTVNDLKQDYDSKIRHSKELDSPKPSNAHRETVEKAAELSNRIDSLQMMSERKYVAKTELEILKSQIEDIERKIQQNNANPNANTNANVHANPNSNVVDSTRKPFDQRPNDYIDEDDFNSNKQYT